MGKIERIQAQIDALQSELAKVAAQPVDDFENHAVIMFHRTLPGRLARELTYAALKVGSRWYLTGKAGERFNPMSWELLCDFIGDFDQADVWYATQWEQV
jgi:hypothetical protein